MLARFAASAVAVAVFSSGASAQSLSFGPQDESNASPNATNSVTFEPPTINDQTTTEWTWRVNVSSVAVPASNDTRLEDPHIVQTTWDMSFGDRPNLASAVQNVTAVCAAVIVRTEWTLNVTRNFDSSDGNCNGVLGNDCVAAIIANSMWDNDTQSCSVTPSLSNIPACRDTLLNGDHELYMALGDLLPEAANSGQGIVRTTSAVHAGSESKARYEEELNQLQLSVIELVSVGPGQTYTALQAICNRVNRGGPADDEDDGQQGSGGNDNDEGGDDNGDDGSAATSDRAWAVGVFGFVTAAVMAAML